MACLHADVMSSLDADIMASLHIDVDFLSVDVMIYCLAGKLRSLTKLLFTIFLPFPQHTQLSRLSSSGLPYCDARCEEPHFSETR